MRNGHVKGGHGASAYNNNGHYGRNSFVAKSSGTWGGADKDLAEELEK